MSAQVDASAYRRDLAELIEVFRAAASERDARPDFVDGELGWVRFERAQMHDAVNRLRARRGAPPATAEQILIAENRAAGHIDYAQKFALGCADLVHESAGA